GLRWGVEWGRDARSALSLRLGLGVLFRRPSLDDLVLRDETVLVRVQAFEKLQPTLELLLADLPVAILVHGHQPLEDRPSARRGGSLGGLGLAAGRLGGRLPGSGNDQLGQFLSGDKAILVGI